MGAAPALSFEGGIGQAVRLLREIGLDPDDYGAVVGEAPLPPDIPLPGRHRVRWRSVYLSPRPGRRGRALRYVGGRGLFWTGRPESWTEEQRALLECCCPRQAASVPVVFERPDVITVEQVPPDLWSEPLLWELPVVVVPRRLGDRSRLVRV